MSDGLVLNPSKSDENSQPYDNNNNDIMIIIIQVLANKMDKEYVQNEYANIQIIIE